MDFDDSAEEAAVRRDAQAWLEQHAPARSRAGMDLMRAYRPRTESDDAAIVQRARDWQAKKADAGWVGMHWPEQFGGRGMSASLASIFAEEESAYDVPGRFFQVGVDMVGPTLIEFGSDDQRRQHLPGIQNGTQIWCQLFSEPGAGSDLAALSTRAVPVEGGYRVTGQKVWTTGAHYADWAILLARTSTTQRRHAGISFLLLDMRSAGITVRPLRQIDGGLHFNEVFLDDVFIPGHDLVGVEDGGWAIARRTLSHERTAIGGGGMVEFGQLRELWNALTANLGEVEAAVGRDDLIDLYIRFELLRFLSLRVRTDASAGRPPGPESSVLKLAASALYEKAGDFMMSTQGAAGLLWDDDAPFGGAFSGVFLSQWAPRIGGGTEQIQRNVAAEWVLGLPRDRRP